jgi:hypothetical protein
MEQAGRARPTTRASTIAVDDTRRVPRALAPARVARSGTRLVEEEHIVKYLGPGSAPGRPCRRARRPLHARDCDEQVHD